MIQKILVEKAKLMAAKESMSMNSMVEILDYPFKFIKEKMSEGNKRNIDSIKNIKIAGFGTFFVPKTVTNGLKNKYKDETNMQE